VIFVAPGEGAIGGDASRLETTGVVLVRRRFAPLAGAWSLPGGAVEVGETLEAAVAREIGEETGLAVDVGPIVEVFDRIFRDADGRVQYHYVLVDYICRVRSGTLRAGSDVADAVVAPTDGLAAFALAEKTLEVIGKALQRQKGMSGHATVS
jgi:8-oxo-dGTP diphosphatase